MQQWETSSKKTRHIPPYRQTLTNTSLAPSFPLPAVSQEAAHKAPLDCPHLAENSLTSLKKRRKRTHSMLGTCRAHACMRISQRSAVDAVRKPQPALKKSETSAALVQSCDSLRGALSSEFRKCLTSSPDVATELHNAACNKRRGHANPCRTSARSHMLAPTSNVLR